MDGNDGNESYSDGRRVATGNEPNSDLVATKRSKRLSVPTLLVYIVGALGGFGLYSALLIPFDRAAPIDYLEAEATTKQAAAGGTIDIHFDVYRYRICPVIRANRIIQDSDGIRHTVSNYTIASQTRPGRESYDRTITIPETVKPGMVFYQLEIFFACNWTQNLGWPIVVTSPPVWFKVTPMELLGEETPPDLTSPDPADRIRP